MVAAKRKKVFLKKPSAANSETARMGNQNKSFSENVAQANTMKSMKCNLSEIFGFANTFPHRRPNSLCQSFVLGLGTLVGNQ